MNTKKKLSLALSHIQHLNLSPSDLTGLSSQCDSYGSRNVIFDNWKKKRAVNKNILIYLDIGHRMLEEQQIK